MNNVRVVKVKYKTIIYFYQLIESLVSLIAK